MKKPFRHNQLSDQVCDVPGCTKQIKLNVLSRKPNVTKCYKHLIGEKRKDQGHNTITNG